MKRILLFVIFSIVCFDLFANDFINVLSKELSITFASRNTYFVGSYKNVYITLWKKNLNGYEDEPGFNTSQSLKDLLNDINSNKKIEYGFGVSFRINKIGNYTFVDYLCFSQYESADIKLQNNLIIFSGNTAIVLRMEYFETWGDDKYEEVKKIFKSYALIDERYKTQGFSNNSGYDNELIWISNNIERAADLIRKRKIIELNDWYFNTQKIINICVEISK